MKALKGMISASLCAVLVLGCHKAPPVTGVVGTWKLLPVEFSKKSGNAALDSGLEKGAGLASATTSLEFKPNKTFELKTMMGLTTGTYVESGHSYVLTVNSINGKPVHYAWGTLVFSDDGRVLENKAAATAGMTMKFVRP